ncbi:MAG: TadE/TadG family type IV pilus assembly protein [Alphaproteobacteria bacterium]
MKRISDRLRAAARPPDLARDQNGNATVEMALIALPLFLFVFAVVNAGYALWLQNALESSVAQAARCATVNPSLCGTASQVTAYAAAQSGAGFDSSTFSFEPQASCGNLVSAAYPLSLTPPFASISLNLSAQACYPI